MDYKIVVCSHDRVHTLKKKTLATLEKYQIPKDKIHIFVAEDEEDAYRQALDGYKICPGEKGLAQQRNAVSRYFESDEPLFCMDDDISGFYCSENKKIVPLADLDAFIKQGFQKAKEVGASLWGLYPVKNALWLKKSIQRGLVFIYGCSFGLYNKKDVQITLALKEDVERTLKFYQRDGVVLRLNWVAPGQSYRKGKGGLSSLRTLEREEAECDTIVRDWPSLAKKVVKKERYDIRLATPNHEAGL